MFDYFKKKQERVYALNARVGSKVVLDVSHLIIASNIKFRNDLPTDYSVLAVSNFELGGIKVNDINIYNDEADVELIIRVFNDNDIVIYEQIDQVYLHEAMDEWLDRKFGKLYADVLNINDTDYNKQWITEDITVNYTYLNDDQQLEDGTYEISNASLFSREVDEIGSEYIYLTLEESAVNVYIGIDFNKNAIIVN